MREKRWVPLKLDDLPPSLLYALNTANRESRRNWLVCEQKVVEVPDSDSAEIARLRQKVQVLERQLARRKIPDQNEVEVYVRDRVAHGQVVVCSQEDWPQYRQALQKLAAELLDKRQGVFANIALNEVRRLDTVYGAPEVTE